MPSLDGPLLYAARRALRPVRAEQHEVFTTGQARAAGLTDAHVRTLLRRGTWVSVRHGWMVEAALAHDAVARHRLACQAALLDLGAGVVVSHGSAWLLHGLPLDDVPLRPHLAVPLAARRVPVGARQAWLPAEHLAQLGDLHLTSLARTVADVLRAAPDELEAQHLADVAAGRGAPPADVLAVLRACEGWPGVRRARHAWRHADPRAESPLESRCRVWFRNGGLPIPDTQVEIRLGGGSAWADFLFPEQRTIVEADGRLKYTDPYVSDGRTLWREKRREDRLRDLGFEVVRATWADAEDGGADLVRRVLRAFERASRRLA